MDVVKRCQISIAACSGGKLDGVAGFETISILIQKYHRVIRESLYIDQEKVPPQIGFNPRGGLLPAVKPIIVSIFGCHSNSISQINGWM